MNWRDYITVDPNICHGKACIKGSRVLVSVVLDNLAAGETPQAIASAYHISLDEISAALSYASALSRESTLWTGAV